MVAWITCLLVGHKWNKTPVPVWVGHDKEKVLIQPCERCGDLRFVQRKRQRPI